MESSFRGGASLAVTAGLVDLLFKRMFGTQPSFANNKIVVPSGIIKADASGGRSNDKVYWIDNTTEFDITNEPSGQYFLHFSVPGTVVLYYTNTPGRPEQGNDTLWQVTIGGTVGGTRITTFLKRNDAETIANTLEPIGTPLWMRDKMAHTNLDEAALGTSNARAATNGFVQKNIADYMTKRVLEDPNQWFNPNFKRVTPVTNTMGEDANNMDIANVQFVRQNTRSLPKKHVGQLPVPTVANSPTEENRRVLVDHFAVKAELVLKNATRKEIIFEPRSAFAQEWTFVTVTGTSQGFITGGPTKVTIQPGGTHTFIADHTVARMYIFADNRDNGWGRRDTKMIDVSMNGNANIVFFDATIVEQ